MMVRLHVSRATKRRNRNACDVAFSEGTASFGLVRFLVCGKWGGYVSKCIIIYPLFAISKHKGMSEKTDKATDGVMIFWRRSVKGILSVSV